MINEEAAGGARRRRGQWKRRGSGVAGARERDSTKYKLYEIQRASREQTAFPVRQATLLLRKIRILHLILMPVSGAHFVLNSILRLLD